METLKGKLKYISLFNPIELTTIDGVLDLRDNYFNLFANINGKPATMKNTMNSIEISVDEASEYHMEFKKDDKEETLLIILTKKPEFGFSNITAFLPDMLNRLNAMQVIVTITEDSIKIENDPEEQVYELSYTHNNSCKISDDKIKEICKIGEVKDCCIFLTVGPDGFTCEKFNSSLAHMLLDRYSRGTMRANRIGNCKIVRRID
jgi:hypothetical protein